MYVRRCAWHRTYHGRVKILGVSSWRGWGVTFSDGMCVDCAARARAEWDLPALVRPEPRRRFGAMRPDLVFAATVALIVMTSAIGIAVGPPHSVQNRIAAFTEKRKAPRSVAVAPRPAPAAPSASRVVPGGPSASPMMPDHSLTAEKPQTTRVLIAAGPMPVARPTRVARAPYAVAPSNETAFADTTPELMLVASAPIVEDVWPEPSSLQAP